MEITLVQQGGFAGLTMRRHVDTARLASAEAAMVEAMVNGCSFFAIPDVPPKRPPVADRYLYRLTVDDGPRKHTVMMMDGALPPGAEPLLDWLQRQPPER